MGTLVVQTPWFNSAHEHVLKFKVCTVATQTSCMTNAQFIDKSPDITNHILYIFYRWLSLGLLNCCNTKFTLNPTMNAF